MVLLPKDDLNIQKVEPILVGKALITAANLRSVQTTEDIICPNIMQHIMVVSMLFRENTDKYASVRAIQTVEISTKRALMKLPEATPAKGLFNTSTLLTIMR